MHQSSYGNMSKFVADYKVGKKKVLDVGSLDINGSYRDLFTGDYTGLDLTAGKNVDLTSWAKVKKESFDVVVSGQTLEHAEDDGELVKKIANALKKGGLCCLIAPSTGVVHDEPDYRRYSVASLSKLVEDAGLKVVETSLSDFPPWRDVVVIGKK